MIKITKGENGKIYINGDEELLAKIEGEDLSGIDVSDLDLNSATLAHQFNEALSKPGPVTVVDGICTYEYHEAKRYAVLKEKLIAQHLPKKLTAVEPFSGTSNLSRTLDTPATSICVLNTGEKDISVSVGGLTFEVPAGVKFDEILDPFYNFSVTATTPFMGFIRRYK